jgi:hypothetical protein
MEEMTKHGEMGRAARKADMDRKTARTYVEAGRLPVEMTSPRMWRTREDPFEEDWAEVEAQLMATPRASHGPDKLVVLAQQHRPGEAAQTDFTRTAELGITIAGQVFLHLLCVFVLPYSNWQWATVCLSESLAALRRGVQRALFQLGRVPHYHQTDNSTAATHRIPDGKGVVLEEGKRPFNTEYVTLMRHFGMTPRTIAIGRKEQNGDVEASNGALKRRLEQALLLRGSRDFESTEAWQVFVDEVVRKANKARGSRVREEVDGMRVLDVSKLPEYTEEDAPVSEWSTIRVKHCAYSVPSRLIGHVVKVHVYEDKIEVYYADKLELGCERMRGRSGHRIDYRHVIWSLVQKPGAFARYVYREPRVLFLHPEPGHALVRHALRSGPRGSRSTRTVTPSSGPSSP